MFDLFAMQIFYSIITTSTRYYPQLCIAMYTLNKLIHYPVIVFFKRSISGLSIVLFIVFQKLRRSCIEDILEFIDRKTTCNQSKTFIEILIGILVFHHIGGRWWVVRWFLVTKMSQVLLIRGLWFDSSVFCLRWGDIRLTSSSSESSTLFDYCVWKQENLDSCKGILLKITIFELCKASIAKLDFLIFWLFTRVWDLVAKDAFFGCVFIAAFFSILSLFATRRFVSLQRF